MNRVPIFFTFDDNYVIPAAVAFFSLVNRAKEGTFYEMHVLHHDISPEHQGLLSEIAAKRGNASLTFVDTGDFLKDEWRSGSWEGHQARSQFTSDAVVRCFGARFLPQYDRIVYSDVDVVFADDVSALMDVDLTDAYCAGVVGFLRHDRTNMSHLKPEHYEMLKDCYLAGGIWVMNLEKIRADRLEDRMLEIIRDDTIVKRWNDQDVMNIACAGKVRRLPLNYIGYPYLRDYLDRPGLDSPYTRDELYDSIIRPKILHYAAQKPWKAKTEWDKAWWDIADYLRLDVARPPALPDDVTRKIAILQRRRRRWRAAALALSAALVASIVAGLLK